MKSLLLLIIFTFLMFFIRFYFEEKQHEYEFGSHWEYSIVCENNYVYKILSNRRGVIQILNKNGKPKTCEGLKKEIKIWEANRK